MIDRNHTEATLPSSRWWVIWMHVLSGMKQWTIIEIPTPLVQELLIRLFEATQQKPPSWEVFTAAKQTHSDVIWRRELYHREPVSHLVTRGALSAIIYSTTESAISSTFLPKTKRLAPLTYRSPLLTSYLTTAPQAMHQDQATLGLVASKTPNFWITRKNLTQIAAVWSSLNKSEANLSKSPSKSSRPNPSTSPPQSPFPHPRHQIHTQSHRPKSSKIKLFKNRLSKTKLKKRTRRMISIEQTHRTKNWCLPHYNKVCQQIRAHTPTQWTGNQNKTCTALAWIKRCLKLSLRIRWHPSKSTRTAGTALSPTGDRSQPISRKVSKNSRNLLTGSRTLVTIGQGSRV